MAMTVIECVPNISEGRRADVISFIADSLRAVPGLRVLGVQSDPAHNRSVFTLAGDEKALAIGIPTLFEKAIAAIDLRTHAGEHPRMGAVDVVPFIPIEGVTMEACVALAKSVAADVAKKIAQAIRMSSGGLRFVKAMGIPLEGRGLVQVSMNLTNYEKTPIFRVFELVKREAARYGVQVLESEIVGLVPSAALTQTAEYFLQLEGFSADQILEKKLAD